LSAKLTPRLMPLLRPLGGIVVGLLLAGIIMAWSGYHPAEAFAAMWTGATGLEAGPATSDTMVKIGTGHLNLFLLAQSLAKITPLLFTGTAIALGLRAGLFNIGAQGQMLMGALFAAVVGEMGRRNSAGDGTLNPGLHVFMVLVAGAAVGGAWGAISGVLKAYRGVHEVISTIMLNFAALDIIQYLVTHNLKDDTPGSMSAQSPLMAQTSWLWPYVHGSNFTAGLVLAVLCTFAAALFISRTSTGLQIRAVGLSPDTARASGIDVKRITVLTMALSGAIAGLAGAVEVMGIHHRYVAGVGGTAGFDGIAVALLGNLSGTGVALSALFFGALASGSGYMETTTNVPAPISEIVQAVVILLVGMKIVLKRTLRVPGRKGTDGSG
jgi:general nucleoside transport system permease protein